MTVDCVMSIFLALMGSRKHRSVEENLKSMKQAANIVLEQGERQRLLFYNLTSASQCATAAPAPEDW